MKLELTKKQVEHMIKCLEYCDRVISDYGNIRIKEYSCIVHTNILKKIRKNKK